MDTLPRVEGSGRRPDITKDVQIEGHAMALKLRRQGLTYREVGELLGVTEQTAWKWVMLPLLKTVSANAEDLRHRQMELTNTALTVLQPMVVAGDLDAIGKLNQTLAREAQLFGLNAPTQTEMVVGVASAEDVGFLSLLNRAEQADNGVIEGTVVETE